MDYLDAQFKWRFSIIDHSKATSWTFIFHNQRQSHRELPST